MSDEGYDDQVYHVLTSRHVVLDDSSTRLLQCRLSLTDVLVPILDSLA